MTTHRPTAEAGSLPNWLPDVTLFDVHVGEVYLYLPANRAAATRQP